MLFGNYILLLIKKISSLSKLKNLGSQTALYGVSTILVRLINYVLAPVQTRVIVDQASFGIISVMFAYIAFLNVLFMYGMETAYFRYATQSEEKESVFKTSNTLLFISTAFLVSLLMLFSNQIASFISYPGYGHIVQIFALIIGFDTLVNIPFAKLRLEGKPLKYLLIKLTNVLCNVGLNLFFLAPGYFQDPDLFAGIDFHYQAENVVYYVFIANLIASLVTFIIFLPSIVRVGFELNKAIAKTLWRYGSPLIIVGLAGIVNEVIDRVMLKKYLNGTAKEVDIKIGIYSACYKVAILMNLCVQAFRMGAEPFFFRQAKDKDAKKTNADVMLVFSIFMLAMFLLISLFLPYFIQLIGTEYRSGLFIIPYLCIAYYLLGIFYNLSTWYKLTDKTHLAGYVSIIGALSTIASTYLLIPHYDILAGALGTIVGYAVMCLLSYLMGQKHYPVNYNITKMFFYFILAIGLYLFSSKIIVPMVDSIWMRNFIHISFIMAYLGIAYMWDIKSKLMIEKTNGE